MGNIDYSKVIENDYEKDFYVECHEKIRDYLSKNRGVSFWQIVKNLQGSDRRILRLLNQMVLAGEIKFIDKIFYLTGEDKKSKGTTNIDDRELLKIKSILEKIFKDKPNPTFLYDQRPVTLDTTLRRAIYLLARGDLENKKIVLVGDDDLTSLAIGLLKKAEEIVVFDIDQRLLDFIEKIAKEYSLPIKTVCYDLTKKIPENYSGKFDVFLTDPTPKPIPFSLFVSIGICLLKKEKQKVGYISFFPSHQSISIDFQKVLTDLGVIITDMVPKFTNYDFIKETYGVEDLILLAKFDSGEERMSFHENLTRIETTNETLRKVTSLDQANARDLMGKATERILNDLSLDPAYRRGEKEFVSNLSKGMVKNE